MTPDELRALLRHPEGLKLDFKREYKLQKTPPASVERQLWVAFTNGQWDEFIKDIIALTNGNVGTADKIARLVIGADDKINQDGLRDLYDTSYLQLTPQQIMAKVNSTCTPPIADIAFEQVMVDDKLISIVSILPTPYVHEINRPLAILPGIFDQDGRLIGAKPSKTYTEYTAFIRKGEDTSPASGNERRALESDKRFEIVALNESIKQELIDNLKHLLWKHDEGIFDTRFAYKSFKVKYPLTFNQDIIANRKDLARLLFPFLAATGSVNNVSSQFIDYAITSGKYLVYDAASGQYVRSVFLRRIIQLQSSMMRLKHFYNVDSNTRFLSLVSLKNNDREIFTLPSDIMMFVYALLDRYEDIINLSGALILYIMGDRDRLDNLSLNASTPAVDQVQQMEKESLSEATILRWITEDFQY